MPRFPVFRHARWLWTGFILTLCGGVLVAAPVSEWSVRVWKTEDGLLNNGINSLAQTPSGYLWVATESGLARFDGSRFEDFSTTLNTATHNQSITALMVGRDGSLWLATERGRIINFGPQGTQVFTNGLPDQWPESLAEDSKDGVCWITYRDGSVIRLDHGAATAIRIPDDMPTGRFTSFTIDNRGQLWFAKGGEVGIYRDGKFTTMVETKDITAAVTRARSGGVWICVRNELYKFGEDAKLQDVGSLGLDVSTTTAASPILLLEDRDGNVWIGTSPAGLMCFDGRRIQHIPTSGRYVSALLQDREGNIWAATSGGGLDRLQRRVVSAEGLMTGAPFERADSVCEDNTGAIWVAARGGILARKTGDTWEDMTRRAWPGGGALCVTVDRFGAVWIGTSAKKYVRWQNGTFYPSAKNDVKGQIIHAVLAKKNGDIYFGEERPDVVQHYHQGQLTTLELPDGIGIVRALIEDAAGNVWIGTEKGALLLVTGDNVTQIARQTEDAFMSIRALYAAEDGSVWIGYGGAGLGRLKDGRIARVDAGNGLPDNYISQIVQDEHGWFWFGSDHGLFRAQERELNAVADGREKQVRAVLHGEEEGSSSVQASYGFAWPGAVRSSDGRIWMPMRNALTVVDPSQTHDDPLPSPVLLTRVVVDEKLVASYGGVVPVGGMVDLRQSDTRLQLSPRHRRVEFDFTALSLQAPENVRFRYWLEGYDERRGEPTSTRSVSYSRLAAGSYRFHVIGCNSSGIWNETGATLAFTVRPFFWQTWWFRASMLGLFAATIVSLVRYVSFRRLRKQLRIMERQAVVDKERARIAQDLHDDLGASMTRMTLLLELASKNGNDPSATANHVQEGLEAAREAIKSLDAAVWAVNPRNNTLPELVDYIGQFGMEFLQNAKVRCELDLPDNPPNRLVSGELRHQLFLVVKESLNNVVRHADATTVSLRIQADDEHIAVEIKDDGRGFEQAPDNSLADGLRNMQQRMAEIKGRCEIESRPGAGTRISVEYMWPVETSEN